MKIFIIHGWTYTLDAWTEILQKLQEAGYEPIMLRVPGLTIPSDYPWTIEDYVSWLREQIGEEDDPVIIAHSNGGRIALNYASTYPEHIKRLILLDSAGIPRKEKTISVRKTIGKFFARILKPILRGRVRTFAYRLIGAGDYGRAEPHMRKTMANMLDSDNRLHVENIMAHVDFIWGENDKSTPLYTAKELKNRLPNTGKIRVIRGAQHSPHQSHTARVMHHLNSILDSH